MNNAGERIAALLKAGRFEEATGPLTALFFRAPLTKGLVSLLLDVLFAQRQFEQGIKIAERYLVLCPQDHRIRLALTRFYFALEDWWHGWQAFEHRFHVVPNLMPNEAAATSTRWHCNDRPKRLLLFGEQGLGDMIMFARYPAAHNRGRVSHIHSTT